MEPIHQNNDNDSVTDEPEREITMEQDTDHTGFHF